MPFPPAAMHKVWPGVHASALISVCNCCICVNVAPLSVVEAITENAKPWPTSRHVGPWHAICQPNGYASDALDTVHDAPPFDVCIATPAQYVTPWPPH